MFLNRYFGAQKSVPQVLAAAWESFIFSVEKEKVYQLSFCAHCCKWINFKVNYSKNLFALSNMHNIAMFTFNKEVLLTFYLLIFAKATILHLLRGVSSSASFNTHIFTMLILSLLLQEGSQMSVVRQKGRWKTLKIISSQIANS